MPPSDDLVRKFTEMMGAKTGPIYSHLWVECVELNTCWGEFKALYAEEENFKIFNSSAPAFFNLLQVIMAQDIVLRIARITDRSSAQKNLSLVILQKSLTTEQRTKSVSNFDAADLDSKSAVTWRHKFYAHRDLETTLNSASTALPEININIIQQAITSINAVMDSVDQLFGGGITVWDIDSGSASKQLIRRLKAAR